MCTEITQHPGNFIFAQNDTLKTTSLKVAEAFGKRHDDVLRKLKGLDCSPEFNARNFAAVDYTDSKGEKRPMWEMTKDGFMFLVMGFTGKKAARIKEAYITAFNFMAEQLRNPKPPAQMTNPLEDKAVRRAINRRAHALAQTGETVLRERLLEAVCQQVANQPGIQPDDLVRWIEVQAVVEPTPKTEPAHKLNPVPTPKAPALPANVPPRTLYDLGYVQDRRNDDSHRTNIEWWSFQRPGSETNWSGEGAAELGRKFFAQTAQLAQTNPADAEQAILWSLMKTIGGSVEGVGMKFTELEFCRHISRATVAWMIAAGDGVLPPAHEVKRGRKQIRRTS